MKGIRICAVVTGRTMNEFLGNLEKTQEVADLVELRVDYIEGLSVSGIDLIKSKIKKQAIFTCRKKEEGGFFSGKESERVEILKRAIELGFDFVDVELAVVSNPSQPPLVRGGERASFLSKGGLLGSPPDKGELEGVKVILSFHDFTKTPMLSELEEIKKQMKTYSPDIMKIATLVRDDTDSKILFQFLLNKQDDEKMIVVGMGEEGKIVRALGSVLGSYLTYASTDYSTSAPGQIDIIKLKKLYNIIDVGFKM